MSMLNAYVSFFSPVHRRICYGTVRRVFADGCVQVEIGDVIPASYIVFAHNIRVII